MIYRGEAVVRPGMKEFGGVRGLALDTEQYVESSGPGWGNRWARISEFWLHYCQYDGSGRCEEGIRATLCAELLPGQRTISANEVSSGGSLLAFQLQFDKFDCGPHAAADKKAIALHLQFRRWQF